MKGILAILVGLLLCAAVCLGTETKQEEHKEKLSFKAAKADLYWDEWGIPHIFAESFESLSYAFGYAQARDHGQTLTRMYFFSSGKAAEVSRFYSVIDRLVYTYRLKYFTDLYYDIQDPETVVALESFAEGFNAFAEKNPALFDGDFAEILPLTGYKVFAANLRILYTFAFLNLLETRLGFEGKYGKDPLMAERLKNEDVFYGAYETEDILSVLGVPDELRHLIGSNAWAINSRSGRSDGKPKLVQNPHLPYQAFFRWYEAQLVCESCDINVYGAALLGIPNLQIAFNDYLGWTHTVNPIQPFTTYIVDLASENSYYYDGEIRQITTEQWTYRVKQLIGYKEVTVINEFTVQGQIIARADGKVLVKRLAGFDDAIRPDAVKQWWDMGRAKSLAEFKAVMNTLQIPMFYTIVTTRDDDIMINFNGWVPDRKGKGDYAYWKSPVNGSTSETYWTGIHTWEELPTLENPPSGFVQNANEPPWTNTLPVFTLDPSRFVAYIAPTAEVSYRPQVSLRLMSSHTNISFDQLVELKHSTFKEATAHTLDDLLKAVEAFGQNSQDAKDGAAVLAKWDRLTETTSRGADLFIAWIRRSPPTEELFVNLWDPADPLNTPNTLKDPQLAVANLEAAVQALRDRGVALDSQYGENNLLFNGAFTERNFLPGNGCADCFRNAYYILGLGLGGDSYVGIVEWDKNGVVNAKALLGYGNATPKSAGAAKHLNDQNGLFSNKEMRTIWRTREEVLAHLEEYVALEF